MKQYSEDPFEPHDLVLCDARALQTDVIQRRQAGTVSLYGAEWRDVLRDHCPPGNEGESADTDELVADGTVAPSTDPTPKSRPEAIRRQAEVSASQHDRVRALAGYGMTVDEVAELYGVQVGVIERIVGRD
jgi:hypothetical protein